MKENIIFIIKKLLPAWLVNRVREYRKKQRFLKRFSYNNGKQFFKGIEVEGVSFDICLNPFLNSGVDDVIADTGFWETPLSRNLKKYLSTDKVFVDIGANIGYHSLFASRLLMNGGSVYSFEPQLSVYEQLLQSIKKNKLSNIFAFNTALSDHKGEETLYVREENIGGSTLLTLSEMESFHVDSSMKVSLMTLDSYMEIFPRVDVVKIDVEGYEYEVFKGSEKILDQYHPIIFMEFSPVFYVQDYATKPQELVIFLQNKGYRFFTMDDKEIELLSWLKRDNNINSQIDIICKNNQSYFL